ncbi:MAG: EAL domain-containing protein [Pseudomonadota bacterium]
MISRMIGALPIRYWMKQAFMLVGLTAVALIAGISLSLAGVASFVSGFAITLGALALGFVWFRQNVVLKELREIKNHALNIAHFEDEIERRLERINLHSAPETLQAPLADLSDRLETLETASGTVERRLKDIELEHQKQNFNEGSATADMPMAGMPAAATLTDFADGAGVLSVPPQAGILDKTKIRAALRDGNLAMHLQPVVTLPARQASAFEAFMRLQDTKGEFIDNAEFIKVANAAKLTPSIDKKILFSSVRMLRRLNTQKKQAGVICNLSASTLADSRAFEQIEEHLSANRVLGPLLTLQISQRDFNNLKPREMDRLGQIADLGYGFCLNGVLDLALDCAMLKGRGFKMIKVATPVLLHADVGSDGQTYRATDLAANARTHGLSLIADELDEERDAVALIDLNIAYGQGLLFAPPRPVKAELLANEAGRKPSASAA